tara:strand:+ start:9 stop:464 length:456 start_codon:yes stop_codon:yes gene_type:complete
MNKKIYGRVSDTKGKYGGLGFGGQIGIDWMEMTRITDIQNGWTEWDEREFDYDKMFIVESKLNQLVQTCRSLGLTDKQITGIHVGETEDDMGYKFRKLSLDQLKDPIFMKEWIDNGCGKNDDNEDYKTVKIGRNDKCICGSGKKFKRCCLN